jgi:nucleotide-binding universal stress UspA family protein
MMTQEGAIGTVVVSTDFSEIGDAAIPHAFRAARERGASVALVHVLDARPTPNPLYAHYYPMPTPDQIQKAGADADAALRARVPEAYRGSVPFESVVTEGSPARQIAELAERGASLIVIASHGRSGLLRLALGSVAERVIREAPCPVLVVR